MIKKLLIALLFTVLITFCVLWMVNSLNNSVASKSYIRSFDRIVEIEEPAYDSLEKDGSLTWLKSISPVDARFIDDKLVILHTDGDSAITIADYSNKKIIGRDIGFGKGPNEVVTPWSLVNFSFEKPGFSIYDASLTRFVNHYIDERTNNYSGITRFKESDGYINEPSWINDTTIVATGFFTSGRVAFFSSAGKLLKYTGAIPLDNRKDPISVRQQAYQSSLSVKPNGEKIILATRYSDKIEIYNKTGEPETLIKGIESFEPQYNVEYSRGTPTMSSGDDLKFGYVDIATTDSYIYGLYSGKVRGAGDANFGKLIHVFDWEGKLINAFQLLHNTLSMDVDNSGNTLIAVHPFLDEEIANYKLNIKQ